MAPVRDHRIGRGSITRGGPPTALPGSTVRTISDPQPDLRLRTLSRAHELVELVATDARRRPLVLRLTLTHQTGPR